MNDFLANLFSRRPIPKAIGSFIALLLLANLLAVGFQRGLINPDRPMRQEQVVGALFQRHAERQEIEDVLGRAKADFVNPELERTIEEAEYYLPLSQTIGRHRRLISREASLEPEESNDLQEFLATDYQQIPEEAFVVLEEVQAGSVVYTPEENYEVLCATDMSSEEAFDAYAEKMIEKQWLPEYVSYDRSLDRGVFEIVRADPNMTIKILIDGSANIFPDHETTILWSLDLTEEESE